MEIYETRSARHCRSTRYKKQKMINGKTAVPILGIGMLLAPTALALQPTTVGAQEVSYDDGTLALNFINQIAPAAAQIAAANDLYASVMIAQAMVESGNGTSQLAQAPYYNLFGVKGDYYGQAVTFPTLEYLNGEWVTIDEPFRQYNSYWEAMQDQASVLRNVSIISGTYHYAGAWKSNTNSFYDATAHLTGRYATDPTYHLKLNHLIEAYGLTAYDTPATYVQQTAAAPATASYSEPAAVSYGSYTVVSGDTLWDIANRFGTTVDQLMANNGLTTDLILVGQTLAV